MLSDPVRVRSGPPGSGDDPSGDGARTVAHRPRWAAGTLTVVAAGWVFVALVVPDRPQQLVPAALARLPVEAVLGALLLVAAPPRWRRPAALLLGVGLGLVALLKALDVGFRSVLDRPFDPVGDWTLLRDGLGFVNSTYGRAGAAAAAAGAVVLVVGLPVLTALAVRRLGAAAGRHRGAVTRAAMGVGAAWAALALLGTQLVANVPVAGRGSAALAVRGVLRVPEGLADRRQFAAELARDPYAATPGPALLTGLRGKDVVLAFVESYGRVALEDPVHAPATRAALDADAARLAAAGYSARTGWLTSATFGGGSWLGHSTLLSGAWVDSQQRYDTLVEGDRMSLNNAFRRAGWRTVDVAPGITRAWPEGAWYGYDRVYGEKALGYRGEAFSWATMPDQFTLQRFQQLEYGRRRGPLMAQLTLVSSHAPWTPLPRTVDWGEIGDGSVFATDAGREGVPRAAIRGDRHRTRAQYAASIRYSVDSLVSWVERYGDDDLVLVFLGDHQPAAAVSGRDAGHDVPVTVVAHDPGVLRRIEGWGWAEGLRPAAGTPVWPMSAFRDRFLAAFGSRPAPRRGPMPSTLRR